MAFLLRVLFRSALYVQERGTSPAWLVGCSNISFVAQPGRSPLEFQALIEYGILPLVLGTPTDDHSGCATKEIFEQLTSHAGEVTVLTEGLQRLFLTNLMNRTTVKPESKDNFEFLH